MSENNLRMAGVTRMRKRPEALILDRSEDYGTAIRRDGRGRLVPAAIAAGLGVQLVDVPDIERPDKRVTVRVARRIDPLIAILSLRLDHTTGRISGHDDDKLKFAAAERFRRDCILADHGVSGSSGVVRERVDEDQDYTLLDARLDAQGRASAAWLAVRGTENDSEIAQAVRVVVLGYATLEDCRRVLARRMTTAAEKLDIGLSRLTNHYDRA